MNTCHLVLVNVQLLVTMKYMHDLSCVLTVSDTVVKANQELLKTAGTATTASLVGYKYDASYPVLIKNRIGPGLRSRCNR